MCLVSIFCFIFFLIVDINIYCRCKIKTLTKVKQSLLQSKDVRFNLKLDRFYKKAVNVLDSGGKACCTKNVHHILLIGTQT